MSAKFQCAISNHYKVIDNRKQTPPPSRSSPLTFMTSGTNSDSVCDTGNVSSSLRFPISAFQNAFKLLFSYCNHDYPATWAQVIGRIS